MSWKGHVRFLGEKGRVIFLTYPTNNIGFISLNNNKFVNTVNGEDIKGMAIYNDVNAITMVSNDTFETKYNGSIDTINQENKYIYNSDVVNSEGPGTRGITVYLDVF